MPTAPGSCQCILDQVAQGAHQAVGIAEHAGPLTEMKGHVGAERAEPCLFRRLTGDLGQIEGLPWSRLVRLEPGQPE